MEFNNLVKKNRSYRRFDENLEIPEKKLDSVLENLRFVPSAANLQPLRYISVTRRDVGIELFASLKWAGYLSEWGGPEEGERPTAYIVILGDRKLSPYVDWDYGIALQTILLGLVDSGLGGCAIAAFDKQKVRELLEVDSSLDILGVVAAGKPVEKVVVDDYVDSVKYWRDEEGIHHVPKKSVEDMVKKIV